METARRRSAASSSVASPRNYARLLCDQGDFTGARPLIERALAIREKALGPEHPDTATSLNNLAFLLREQGDLAGARPLYERALGQSGSRSSAPTIPSQRRASTTSRACFVTRATSLGRDRLFIARWGNQGAGVRPRAFPHSGEPQHPLRQRGARPRPLSPTNRCGLLSRSPGDLCGLPNSLNTRRFSPSVRFRTDSTMTPNGQNAQLRGHWASEGLLLRRAQIGDVGRPHSAAHL